MALVHEFPLTSNLYDDTRVPFQYPGNGEDPAADGLAFSLAALRSYLVEKKMYSTSEVVTTSTHTFSIPAGRWLVGIAVESASGQSFNLGVSAGTDELIGLGTVTGGGGPESFPQVIYGGSAGKTIYFSSLTGTLTITFLLI